METADLRYGRLALLLFVAGLVAGAAVHVVRTIPDPDLFTSATGRLVALAVTVAILGTAVLQRPSWLIRRHPSSPTG